MRTSKPLAISIVFRTYRAVPRDGLILLIWIDFNTGMDNDYTHNDVWDKISHHFPNFNRTATKVVSSYTLLGMWLLIHAGNIIQACKGDPSWCW